MRGKATCWLSETSYTTWLGPTMSAEPAEPPAGTHNPGSETSPGGRAGPGRGRVVGVLTVIGICPLTAARSCPETIRAITQCDCVDR